jgi:hypothetical protein
MMTCSLKLSKKLWDKGLRIETEKWWVCRTPNKFEIEIQKPFVIYANYPAPSTDELLAVMPPE